MLFIKNIPVLVKRTRNEDSGRTEIGPSVRHIPSLKCILRAIDSKFRVTPWLMIVTTFLIYIIIKKIPALPVLNTIWLILAAMVFGGTIESAGLLIKSTSIVIVGTEHRFPGGHHHA